MAIKRFVKKTLMYTTIAFSMGSITNTYAAIDESDSASITNLKAHEAETIAPYQNYVQTLAGAQRQQAIQQTQQSYPNPMGVREAKGKVLVFISSSQPEASLQQWFQEANQMNIPVILRGFVNNSLGATKSWTKALMDSNQGRGGIQIDPVAYEIYGVKSVPAVVVTSQVPTCYGNDPCKAPPFDIVYGNVTLEEALATIAVKGDSGKAIAAQKLQEIKKIQNQNNQNIINSENNNA